MACCNREPNRPVVTSETELKLLKTYKQVNYDTNLKSLPLSLKLFLVDLKYAEIVKL